MDKIKEIEELLKTDEEKAARYKEALESVSQEAGDLEAICAAVAAIGLELTSEELERHLAAAQELSDDDLLQVAGGDDWNYDKAADGHDRWCLRDWHCYTINMDDTGGGRLASCQKDWQCVIAWNDGGN